MGPRGGGVRDPEAVKYGIDFLEITIPDPRVIDAAHTRALLERHEVDCVCSLGHAARPLPTNNPEGALEYLKIALDQSKAIGAKALSGVVYGGIGQRTGFADAGRNRRDRAHRREGGKLRQRSRHDSTASRL